MNGIDAVELLAALSRSVGWRVGRSQPPLPHIGLVTGQIQY